MEAERVSPATPEKTMTLDALIHDISGQLVNVEGLVYELQQALDTLSSDAAEAANLIEADTPEQPDDDEEEPEEGDYDDTDAYTAAMEKHAAAVAAADEIREKIDRMETLQELLRDLENADQPEELEVNEYELGDAFAALSE